MSAERGIPSIVIWTCPEPGCEYRVNSFDSGAAEGHPGRYRNPQADRRAIARFKAEHYPAAHPGVVWLADR